MLTGKTPVLPVYTQRPRRNAANKADMIRKLSDARCEEVTYVCV